MPSRYRRPRLRISIHAPLTRCDLCYCFGLTKQPYFNPRTSYEVRLYKFSANLQVSCYFNPRTSYEVRHVGIGCGLGNIQFQSTHLLRGATGGSSLTCGRRLFQSTHLLRGATNKLSDGLKYIEFQSTHLLRGATSAVTGSATELGISIHAPLTRCDGYLTDLAFHKGEFQSTHLLRGATRNDLHLNRFIAISIHAPLTRCDPCPWEAFSP